MSTFLAFAHSARHQGGVPSGTCVIENFQARGVTGRGHLIRFEAGEAGL